MNWKLFFVACSSVIAVSFPQNIIGCGPDSDPYDYYTSFFHNTLNEASGYKPFYYTGSNFLYDENETFNTAQLLSEEWANYCKNGTTATDAYAIVNGISWRDLDKVYQAIQKNQTLKLSDSVAHNTMLAYFQKTKDLEALGYILYAKKVEPFVVGNSDYWEPAVRDSAQMNKLIQDGVQLYNATKSPLLQLKYGYQITRLALYSDRYEDAIKMYDKYIAPNTIESVLQPIALALKAGAYFRTGKQMEAAYLFSKAFSNSPAKRISNYLGFTWSINDSSKREQYLQFCKNDEEKANMLALFGMNSINNESAILATIQQLHPNAAALDMLAIREINKMEEKYFTPILKSEAGGSTFFYYWDSGNNTDSFLLEGKSKAIELSNALHEIAINPKAKNAALMETGAAYCAFMGRDFPKAKQLIADADKLNPSNKVKDQLELTRLLVNISAQENIDANFEAAILPALQWLEAKAKNENVNSSEYNFQNRPWTKSYRDLMSEILARRYHRQGDLHKEVLCISAADKIVSDENHSIMALEFMRSQLNSKQVEELFQILYNTPDFDYIQFLINHSALEQSDIAEFAGTAYLREYDFANAIEWYKKCKPTSIEIDTNPFADFKNDVIYAVASDKKSKWTKLTFATEMLRQKILAEKSTGKLVAQAYYKMAIGMYNMTYYGHAWNLTEYYRSGVEGYYVPKKAAPYKQEYFRCYTAEKYFEKAKNAGVDPNFKARCLFMMAKCSQKQLTRPQYEDYANNWDKMEIAERQFNKDFRNNKYFAEFKKNYRTTAFYKEAFNSCSYLRDFIKKK
jgi:hypothetical protein